MVVLLTGSAKKKKAKSIRDNMRQLMSEEAEEAAYQAETDAASEEDEHDNVPDFIDGTV